MKSGRWLAGSVHELVQQPTRPHHLSVSRSYPIGESPIGCDHDHVEVRLGDSGDHVVALALRMHYLNTVHVTLAGSRSGSALEYHRHRRLQPSGVHRRPESFQKATCSAGSITPPAGRPRPDHVGRVNHEHPNSVARPLLHSLTGSRSHKTHMRQVSMRSSMRSTSARCPLKCAHSSFASASAFQPST